MTPDRIAELRAKWRNFDFDAELLDGREVAAIVVELLDEVEQLRRENGCAHTLFDDDGQCHDCRRPKPEAKR